jgi:hypothetical protein
MSNVLRLVRSLLRAHGKCQSEEHTLIQIIDPFGCKSYCLKLICDTWDEFGTYSTDLSCLTSEICFLVVAKASQITASRAACSMQCHLISTSQTHCLSLESAGRTDKRDESSLFRVILHNQFSLLIMPPVLYAAHVQIIGLGPGRPSPSPPLLAPGTAPRQLDSACSFSGGSGRTYMATT